MDQLRSTDSARREPPDRPGPQDQLVIGLELVRKEMLAEAGGKAANLGELLAPDCRCRPGSA